jgi:hypothetical protein
VSLPRAERDAAIRQLAQRYAKRLEYYTHLAPYNWFNFYDYWPAEPTLNAQASAGDALPNSDGQGRAGASDGQGGPNVAGARMRRSN